MESIIVALISVLFGAGGVFALLFERKDKVNKILDEVQKNTESINEIKDKVNLLGDESVQTLRYTLHRYYKQFIYQGKVTTEQLSLWDEAFETYAGLGGNHEVHEMNRVVAKLPVDDTLQTVSPFEMEWRKAYDQVKKEEKDRERIDKRRSNDFN